VARKPKSKYKKPYLDSSVFISWVNNETDIEGVDRKAIADGILNAARDGFFRVYTSTLTIAEVHKMRSGPRLEEDRANRLLEFFQSDFILYVDVERRVAEAAHRLCREHGIYPCDGIHLAAALEAKCEVLLAWDDRFEKVKHPGIRIEAPEMAVGQMNIGEATAEEQGKDSTGPVRS